jgi:hypothetical protein
MAKQPFGDRSPALPSDKDEARGLSVEDRGAESNMETNKKGKNEKMKDGKKQIE